MILSQVAFHGYKLLVELVLCALLAVHYGTFSWSAMAAAVPLLLAFFALVTGIGLLGAVLYSFARDVEHIWSLVTHLLMFVTPVFYGLDSLSAPARFVIYWLNPLTPFLVALRGLFIGPPAHPGVYLHAVLIGGGVLIAGYAAFLASRERCPGANVSAPMVRLQQVGKRFLVPRAQRTTLRVLRALVRGEALRHELWALTDVSFEVPVGSRRRAHRPQRLGQDHAAAPPVGHSRPDPRHARARQRAARAVQHHHRLRERALGRGERLPLRRRARHDPAHPDATRGRDHRTAPGSRT